MEENLVDSFYQAIMQESEPGKNLARFLWACLSKPYDPGDIAIMNKLVKVYGRRTVFFSILDLIDVPTLDPNRYYGLLAYFIKRKVQDHYDGLTNYRDLTSMVTELKTQIGSATVDIEKMRGLVYDE